jgi:hypothetical protein
MNLRGPMYAGEACLRCGTGTVMLKSQTPIEGRPGFSEMSFQCSECLDVVTRMQDNRFL